MIDDRLLSFGVSGKLIRNALVMYDRQTDSLWSQILGRAVDGPLEGSALEIVPTVQTTWSAWRDLHPDTIALKKNRAGGFDPYETYYARRTAGILGETNEDDRLPIKTLVAGAIVDGQPVAYPFPVLEEKPVVNDVVGNTGVLAVHFSEANATLLFDRDVDGRRLTFSRDDSVTDQFVLTDEETGSKWLAWRGAAFDGPLAGTILAQLPSTSVFWFGWTDFHPDTLLYENDGAPH